jgi:predicted DNA-binding mobile mystery protein A
MTVKAVVQRQCQRLVDEAADREPPPRPPEGWLRTVRKALGMSGSQLAKKMKVTRARVAQAELAERSGAATLKSMQSIAAAMGCRFVYAIVPPEHVEDLILAQARKKASALVGTASQHMALESQVLPNAKITDEIERLTRELAQGRPADLWNDK